MAPWRALLLTVFASGLISAAPRPTEPSNVDTSFKNILANPVAYNGRSVRLHGFMILEFEGDSLWASEADYRAQRYERALWIDLPGQRRPKHPLNGKRVFMSGVIAARKQGAGHLGLWPAEITDIIEIAPDPSDTDRPRPWLNDPLFVILASLGLLGLILAMMSLGLRGQSLSWPRRRP
jgi:hypothetical protein